MLKNTIALRLLVFRITGAVLSSGQNAHVPYTLKVRRRATP